MNRQERRNAMKQGSNMLLEVSRERNNLRIMNERLEKSLSETMSDLEEARTLVSQLTEQIQDSGRSYMWTLAAIAKANGGEFRIPGSAIDSVQKDDIIEKTLDDIRDEIVFTIRTKGSDAPSGIILPGRSRR